MFLARVPRGGADQHAPDLSRHALPDCPVGRVPDEGVQWRDHAVPHEAVHAPEVHPDDVRGDASDDHHDGDGFGDHVGNLEAFGGSQNDVRMPPPELGEHPASGFGLRIIGGGVREPLHPEGDHAGSR